MSKIVVISIIIAIAIIGFTVLVAQFGFKAGSSASLSQNSGGMLSAEEARFDFGTISMKNGDVSHVFKIKNGGTEPVNIEKVYTSCMCTTATLMMGSRKFGPYGMPGHGLFSKTNITVGPGESATVEAIFDPKAHGPSGVGLAERSIYLETNSAKSPKLELSFRATVTQ